MGNEFTPDTVMTYLTSRRTAAINSLAEAFDVDSDKVIEIVDALEAAGRVRTSRPCGDGNCASCDSCSPAKKGGDTTLKPETIVISLELASDDD
ncbi:MAG: hypothetical protein JXR97_01770 [Planctomycetes bacterium]|nr:hypothetical protein [Planctomycetota bacterium]